MIGRPRHLPVKRHDARRARHTAELVTVDRDVVVDARLVRLDIESDDRKGDRRQMRHITGLVVRVMCCWVTGGLYAVAGQDTRTSNMYR